MKLRDAVFGMVLAVALSAPAVAQIEDGPMRPVRLEGGLHFLGVVPTGEFADHIDSGFGVGLDVVVPVRSESWFAIRGGGAYLVYGDQTRDVPAPGTGGLVNLELSTTNNILVFNIGPQLMLPRGRIRPYANLSGGFAYFSTSSSLKGDDSSEPFATDTNHEDVTMGWVAGGGLLIALSRGNTPVSLDVGAQYYGNGEVEYVTEDGITEGTGGQYVITPTRSDANFVGIRLGVTIGVRPCSHS